MKSRLSFLACVYAGSFILLSIGSVLWVKDCEAYWMHDASFFISRPRLLTDATFLFFLPALVAALDRYRGGGRTSKLWTAHLVSACLCTGALLLMLSQPCETINGGRYAFIAAGPVGGYYLFKWTCLFLLVALLRSIGKALRAPRVKP